MKQQINRPIYRRKPSNNVYGIFFNQFGSVHDIFLAKDADNNTENDVAVITFIHEKDARKARECVGEVGYEHLVLKFDWLRFLFEISFFS